MACFPGLYVYPGGAGCRPADGGKVRRTRVPASWSKMWTCSTSGLTSGAGCGGQRVDSGNAENDWLGLIGGSSDLSLADGGYAAVVAVRRALHLCPMT